jgi:hypothetical protein
LDPIGFSPVGIGVLCIGDTRVLRVKAEHGRGDIHDCGVLAEFGGPERQAGGGDDHAAVIIELLCRAHGGNIDRPAGPAAGNDEHPVPLVIYPVVKIDGVIDRVDGTIGIQHFGMHEGEIASADIGQLVGHLRIVGCCVDIAEIDASQISGDGEEEGDVRHMPASL